MKKLPLIPILLLFLFIPLTTFGSDSASTTTLTLRERMMGVQQRMEERNDLFRSRFEAARSRQQQEFDTNRQLLQQRLASFSDKNKAKVVERINSNFSHVNIVLTDIWLKQLEKMEEFLAKIEGNITQAQTQDKDIGKAKEALDNARNAVVEAKAAVELQAGKNYTITIKSEGNLGQDVRIARNDLNTDLKDTQSKLKDAKKALMDAVRITNQTLGEGGNSK